MNNIIATIKSYYKKGSCMQPNQFRGITFFVFSHNVMKPSEDQGHFLIIVHELHNFQFKMKSGTCCACRTVR